MIFLWTIAHELLGEEKYLQLAQKSAWNVAENRQKINQLCCGRPGQTYGILNLYKHTNDEHWLSLAKQMAQECIDLCQLTVATSRQPYFNSLYKGVTGSVLLSADMANSPKWACMPLFELEGWNR